MSAVLHDASHGPMIWRFIRHQSGVLPQGAPILIYRLLIGPALALILLWAWVRGKETRTSLAERLVIGSMTSRRETPPTLSIWVHGASVGELRAARHLITRLQEHSNFALVVTTNTASAQAMVSEWDVPRLHVARAPADAFGATARFLRRWRVAAQVTLENELWPNRMRVCRAHNLQVFGVGTRPPAALARGKFAKRIAAQSLGLYSRIWPLNSASRQSLAEVIPDARLDTAFNAKATVPAQPKGAPKSQVLAAWAGCDIVLAASTHAPEERLLLDAYRQALPKNPALRMIIAPRHPDRGPRLSRALTNNDISLACRSEGEQVHAHTNLYLADTLHEMALWYHGAPRTIIGGTFAPKGGHTPVEPILAGSLPLHGPDCRNHQDMFDALDLAGGAILLRDQTALIDQLATMMPEPMRRAKLAQGRDVVATLGATAMAQSDAIARYVAQQLNTGNP